MSNRTVLTGGYIVMDVVSGDGFRWWAAGGTAANVAANLAYLGWDSSVMGRVGDDSAGRAVRADLASAGVATRWLHLDKGVATPIIRHEVHADGHRFRYGCDSCGEGKATHRPLLPSFAEAVLGEELAQVFVFDRPSRVNLAIANAYARHGRHVVYEPSTPATKAAHADAASSATVIKYSSQRAAGFRDRLPQPRRGQLIVVTHGSDGSEFSIGDSAMEEIRPPVVDAVDAGGAGDWMTAGLIDVLPDRWTQASARLAIERAQALAALSTLVPGSRTLAEASDRASTRRRASLLLQGGCPRLTFDARSVNVVPACCSNGRAEV